MVDDDCPIKLPSNLPPDALVNAWPEVTLNLFSTPEPWTTTGNSKAMTYKLLDQARQNKMFVEVKETVEVSLSNDPAFGGSSKNVEPLSSPQAVANFFLDCGRTDDISLTPLRLIKLVCIAHGWALAILKKPLFAERIQAWEFGPVVPSLYHEFKIFRKSPIDRYAFQYDFAGNVSVPKVTPDQVVLTSLLRQVWNSYKNFSASDLVALTHRKGTPWFKAQLFNEAVIENREIALHYQELLSTLGAVE